MRILAKTCTVLVVCLAATGSAAAMDLSQAFGRGPGSGTRFQGMIDPLQPFVVVSIPDEPLNLGEVCGPYLTEVGAQVAAHVLANCPFHISASFDGLRHQRMGVEILPKDLTATINGKQVPIGTGSVPVVSQGPTPMGGVDIPLELQVGVKALASYPAGRYGGTLVITVTPGH